MQLYAEWVLERPSGNWLTSAETRHLGVISQHLKDANNVPASCSASSWVLRRRTVFVSRNSIVIDVVYSATMAPWSPPGRAALKILYEVLTRKFACNCVPHVKCSKYDDEQYDTLNSFFNRPSPLNKHLTIELHFHKWTMNVIPWCFQIGN